MRTVGAIYNQTTSNCEGGGATGRNSLDSHTALGRANMTHCSGGFTHVRGPQGSAKHLLLGLLDTAPSRGAGETWLCSAPPGKRAWTPPGLKQPGHPHDGAC